MNFIFISPTFPKNYYQFARAIKNLGQNSLGIAEDPYENLSLELKESLTDYYQVASLENYDEVYRAVAYFAFKYGKIDWLESNNEYWLQSDASLRQDFNITSGAFPAELEHYKYKSKMKEFYAKANVKTARYHLVTNLSEGKAFIKEVGYPVVVKPDNGVGANATFKIKNDAELELFYRTLPNVPYIMEEFINGMIVSYDGICDENSKVIFETSHIFPTPIMDIVNNVDECCYYSVRKIPEDLQKVGRAVIAAFKPRSRFFHCEYFRLLEDKEGLGKKGDILGLEVNMRPPGGYTTDMMNFANDIDVYSIYAQMVMGHVLPYNMQRPYFCAYVGRRNGINYKNSEAKILARYEGKICMHENMPEIISAAMGNDMYTARFKTEKEVHSFIEYCTAKKG
ncbi:MAG: ATP-grasp domain-containing protein [Erysipelotrichaceae bacterium]|nr:ATP-grasp domain-containing protein [Erysipelotrichaceae bacterium]MDY5251910.1 ATP-grasp domain-containing protein [Erysipelotrichaceae bacterium]